MLSRTTGGNARICKPRISRNPMNSRKDMDTACASEEELFALLPPVTTPGEMRQWDADSVELGVPGLVLMENAARGALRVLLEHVGDVRGHDVALVMGSGNNGGDAACLSRMLLDLGANPVLHHLKDVEEYRGDARHYLETAIKCGVTLARTDEFAGGCDILVDGLLGTGFSGELKESAKTLVERMNASGAAFTLALDIPSGLDAMTGSACPTAVRADATATFAAAKPGLLFPWARPFTGEVHVCQIGTPKKAIERTQASFRELHPSCLELLPALLPLGYKNSYGHVLVVGGAHGLSGAAHLAALAALRAGAGLATVACPAAGAHAVKHGLAEIMTCGLGQHDATDWPDDLSTLVPALQRAQALVMGPGMGGGEKAAHFLQKLVCQSAGLPRVLDADALTLLGRVPNPEEVLPSLGSRDVVTPHPGEAKTLLERLGKMDARGMTRLEMAQTLCGLLGCVVVLKGPGTIVARKGAPCLVYPPDIPQLAVGGSGDCLSGIVGALAARGLSPLVAAAMGVVWHGLAGQKLADEYPFRGNFPSQTAHALPKVLKDVFAKDGFARHVFARHVPGKA